MVRCGAYDNFYAKESIAQTHGLDHPLLRHPRRRLLHHNPIAKGRRVAEYTGPRLSKAEPTRLMRRRPSPTCLDWGQARSSSTATAPAMFINHSCDANCETSEIRGRIWIKSIRAIAAGEEITYDYCLYDGGDDEAICNCGRRSAAAQCTRRKRSGGGNGPQRKPRSKPSRKEADRQRQIRPERDGCESLSRGSSSAASAMPPSSFPPSSSIHLGTIQSH